MPTQIDLYAPSIPAARRVWRLFPGSGYRFLAAFESQSVGFLDIPGFLFPVAPLSQASDLIPRIAAAQSIYHSARQGLNSSVNLDEFRNARTSRKRGSFRSAIINFYESAKVNDLIVAPEPSMLSHVRIGRFSTNSIIDAKYSLFSDNVFVKARNIDWIAKVRENTISSALSDTLRNQHPFTILNKDLYVEVFALTYSSFIFGDRHVATVFNQRDYLDADSSLLGLLSRLAAAACFSIDNGISGLGVKSDIDLLLDDPPIDYTCSHEIDIHSPGFNRYVSSKLVPLVISATLAAMTSLASSSAAELHDRIDDTVVINTAPDADPLCNPLVHEATSRILKNYDIDKTLKLCQSGLEASRRAGLKPSAHISSQRPGP